MKVLMLCHDRQIDRRILVQVESLVQDGHQVILFALPHAQAKHSDAKYISDNFSIYRIGAGEILKARHSLVSKITNAVLVNFLLQKLYQFPRLFRFVLDLYRFYPKTKAKINFYFGGSPSLLFNAIFNFKDGFIQAALKQDFDMVQVHDLPLLEAGVALSKLRKVPLVYDSHELFPQQKQYDSLTKRALVAHERRFLIDCHLVFTVNQAFAQDMESRYAIPKPKVLLNALDVPLDLDKDNHHHCLRKYFSLSPETKIVLMQGGLSPHRNLENLVNAFAQVNTADAVLVVMGSGILEKKLQKMAKKLKLYHSKVYFLPAVPQEELLYYTASADLGVIPYPPIDLNTKFCTPNKLFEFIQAGLPILANDLPELRRFVQDTNFGMVHEMNHPKEIAAGIDKALAQLDEQHWRANILAKRHDYSWQAQSKIYVQAIEDLMVGH